MNTPGPGSLEHGALAKLKAGDPAGAEADLLGALSTVTAGHERPRLWEVVGEARLAHGFAFEAAQANSVGVKLPASGPNLKCGLSVTPMGRIVRGAN